MPITYKVAILSRTFPPKGGGIAAAHFNLAKCLQSQHEVMAFAFDDDRSSENMMFRAKTPRWQASALKWLAQKWVRHYAGKESAINCENIFRIVPAARSLSRAINKFNPDFILCPDNFLPGLALRKPMQAKLIWMAHHNYLRFDGNPIASSFSWIDLQLAHRLERRALKKADAIVAVSKYMAEIVNDTLEPSQPIHVIRNFIDAERINRIKASNLRMQLAVSKNVPIIYIPSAGSSVKGERYIFELVRRLGVDGRAAFFLSGGLCTSLIYELSHLGHEIKVATPGCQDYEQNLCDVAACDFVLSPTLLENLSCSLLEALALGIPIVSFDIGGNKELVQTGLNGHLSPYLDIEDMISAATALISDEAGLRRLKENARSSVAGILNPERVLNEYNSLFLDFDTEN